MRRSGRRTKIVCTYGPALEKDNNLAEVIKSGLDVIRLNFSHGNPETMAPVVKKVREVAKEVGREIAILQDLGGPKIRVDGSIPPDGIPLEENQTIKLSYKDSYDGDIIPVNYPHLTQDIKIADRVLFADGAIEAIVSDVEGDVIKCKILHGGRLLPRKGVNLPTSKLSIPALTDKDRVDLEFGLKAGIDIVAVSFVQTADDVKTVRKIVDKHEHKPLIIAKIEKPMAVEEIHNILEYVDGIMVARGDLGVEIPYEDVPMVQKRLIDVAGRAGKSVITATQMLTSMVTNPKPTRAETSDAANAIIDGSDALMLSEETAVGEYPVRAVNTLVNIALSTDKFSSGLNKTNRNDLFCTTTSCAIGHAASMIANSLGAVAIVSYTRSGSTAQAVARFRPECPILGFTPEVATVRKMRLQWGVVPVLSPEFDSTDEIFEFACNWARENEMGEPGSKIVVTAGFPLGSPGSTNLIKVLKI